MKQECRILVVDDDLSFRRLVEKEFKPLGYTVRTAGDGETALDMLEVFRPHIVILDLLLPKMDGFEVARRIKQKPGFQSVHILMVTAVYLDEEDIKRAIRGGADGYYFKPDLILTKPVHIKELKEAVESMRKEDVDFQTVIPKTKDTVLIIDDDEKNRKILKMRLLSENFLVKEAEDGYQGLKMLEEEDCDIVLLDVKMPGMSGIDLLSEIKKKEIDVPIMMMTAYGSESIAVEAFKKGADDYLIKPFDTQTAVKRISDLLERHSLKKSNEKLVNRLKSISIDLIGRLNVMEVQNLRLEEAYLRHKELSDFNQEFVRREAEKVQNTLWDITKAISHCFEEKSPKSQEIFTVQKNLFLSLVSLMNLSRLTAIQARLCHPNLRKMSLKEEIKKILSDWQKPIEECCFPIKLEDNISGDVEITGDSQFLKEIFFNIMSNTILRLEDKGTLTVRLKGKEKENGTIFVDFSDSGKPLEHDDTVKLDLDSLGTRAYKVGGEVLKMSICWYLCETLGWFFSIPNEIPRFTLEIPPVLR
ncbi:MAG: response regulator [Acidobacteria bacterium]|nr:response regulator [Acidobacteriota bacterium]